MGLEARHLIGKWIRIYNREGPLSSHDDDKTPMVEYIEKMAE